MPKIKYKDHRFSIASQTMISQANTIIDEYTASGFSLTLRQLYYQFVSRDLIENTPQAYKRLGSVIVDARLAGLIDWYAIEDRTRSLRGNSHWKDPGEIIFSCYHSFKMDKWKGQDFKVEVWIEKEALIGVISNICRKLDVNFFACKGYVSLSEMWSAANRLRDPNQTPIIVHLGDHDPSGIDMTRDINDRCDLFDGGVTIERIALNMDQIEEYSPPPNFAKVSDARFQDYQKKYGTSSWELDALEPKVLEQLIEEKVLWYRDKDIYYSILEKENEYKAILKKVSENWETL